MNGRKPNSPASGRQFDEKSNSVSGYRERICPDRIYSEAAITITSSPMPSVGTSKRVFSSFSRLFLSLINVIVDQDQSGHFFYLALDSILAQRDIPCHLDVILAVTQY